MTACSPSTGATRTPFRSARTSAAPGRDLRRFRGQPGEAARLLDPGLRPGQAQAGMRGAALIVAGGSGPHDAQVSPDRWPPTIMSWRREGPGRRGRRPGVGRTGRRPMHEDLLSLLPKVEFTAAGVRRHHAGRRLRPGGAAGRRRDDHHRRQGPGGRRGQDPRRRRRRSPPTGRCRPRAGRSRSSWSSRRSSASTSTSRTSAGASPSSATWPSPPSCTPARATSRS